MARGSFMGKKGEKKGYKKESWKFRKEERTMEKAKWVNTIVFFSTWVFKLHLMVEAKMVILFDVVLNCKGI